MEDEIKRRIEKDEEIGGEEKEEGNKKLDGGVEEKSIGEIDIIGDENKMIMVKKRMNERIGGCKDIDEKRREIRDDRRSGKKDGLILMRRDKKERIILNIIKEGRIERK